MTVPHQQNFIRVAVPDPLRPLRKDAMGGTLLSFRYMRYILGIRITIPIQSNETQLLLFIFFDGNICADPFIEP